MKDCTIKCKASAVANLLFILLVTILSGCAATEWQPVTVKTGEIFWPPPPDTKIRYQGEIREFEQTSKSLATFLIGKSEAGKILKPVAVSKGPGDRLAIADQDRKGVHFYDPASKKYKLIVMAGKEKIEGPVGVAFDDAANLYITDSQLNKILIYDSSASFLKSIDTAEGLPLLRPTGIIFNQHDKRIYVSETMRHQILVFSRLGEFISRLGTRGEKPGSLNFPTHIGSDPQGKIYVTDSMNFRAQILDPQNHTWRTFGRHGNGSGDFASPKGIGVDNNGIIYIAETLFDNVQIFNQEGKYLLGIGSQGRGLGQFWMPSGLFIDQNQQLYVCDTYNQRVQIFTLLTGQSAEETHPQQGP